MENKTIGWAMFCNDAAAFSDNFQREMSTQLLQRFYDMLGLDVPHEGSNFMLFIGMQEMQTIIEDDYAFALVEIISPHSTSTLITAYWNTVAGVDLSDATANTTLDASVITFGWCADFDTDYFLEFFKPKTILPKQAQPFPFEVSYDYTLYPDLTLRINFNKAVTPQHLNKVETVFRSCIEDAYISTPILQETDYLIMIDFQGNLYEQGIAALQHAFQVLAASDYGIECIDVG